MSAPRAPHIKSANKNKSQNKVTYPRKERAREKECGARKIYVGGAGGENSKASLKTGYYIHIDEGQKITILMCEMR